MACIPKAGVRKINAHAGVAEPGNAYAWKRGFSRARKHMVLTGRVGSNTKEGSALLSWLSSPRLVRKTHLSASMASIKRSREGHEAARVILVQLVGFPIPGALCSLQLRRETKVQKLTKGKTPPKKHDGPKPGAPSAAMGPKKAAIGVTGREIRGIVRVAGKDMKGELLLSRSLPMVRGVGARLGKVLSNIAFKQLGVPENVAVGELSEDQIQKLENILSNPVQNGVPVHMVNHRKDVETGLDKHFISTDLIFNVRQDIDRDRNMVTWRGYRHQYGQKVRGQHTRSTGRSGMTVGVMRKSLLAKQGSATAGEKKEDKK